MGIQMLYEKIRCYQTLDFDVHVGPLSIIFCFNQELIVQKKYHPCSEEN